MIFVTSSNIQANLRIISEIDCDTCRPLKRERTQVVHRTDVFSPDKDASMTTAEIQRQYDEVIAPHYDRDPYNVIYDSQSRALDQLARHQCLLELLPPMDVLDVGTGTGLFFESLKSRTEREINPHGIDISHHMIEVAKTRIPDLVAAVDDGANIDKHFTDRRFDLICSHFVTGFVELSHLAPRIMAKLKPGGYWSFMGGTDRGFPELQKIANSKKLAFLRGRGEGLNMTGLNIPSTEEEVHEELEKHGYEICSSETFEPELNFRHFEDFLDFGWRGGWLTSSIEGEISAGANKYSTRFCSG